MKRFSLALILAFAALSLPAQNADKPRVSILGDSYSTFDGYMQPWWNAVWYFPESHEYTNKSNDVKKVEQTWWSLVIADMGYVLEKNNSFSGSTVCYTGYNRVDYSDRSFVGRASDLGHPDVILVCGATNDSWSGAPVGSYKWGRWTNEDLHFFRPAMAKMCKELETLYPEARILFILNDGLRDDINDSVHRICRHYRIECVDLKDIDKQDGHPSQAGMASIASQVVSRLRGN